MCQLMPFGIKLSMCDKGSSIVTGYFIKGILKEGDRNPASLKIQVNHHFPFLSKEDSGAGRVPIWSLFFQEFSGENEYKT